MCNEHRRLVAVGGIADVFAELRIPLRFPEGVPNLAPMESIRITDPTALVRRARDGDGAELVQRRWSWPGAGGRPVYNLRSEGREWTSGRCLIPADGFYEFTTPALPPGAPKPKRKTKWLFTLPDEGVFGIAAVWRAGAWGEAFSMLTAEPGPDVAPYHHRQIVILPRNEWAAWLDGSAGSAELLKPTPAGFLEVRCVAGGESPR